MSESLGVWRRISADLRVHVSQPLLSWRLHSWVPVESLSWRCFSLSGCRPLRVFMPSPFSAVGGFEDSHTWVKCSFILNSKALKRQFSSVQLLSRVRLFVTPWTAACQASLSIANSQSLLKFMFIESGVPSNHLIPCYPLLLLPSIFPSIRVFSNESFLRIRWPKYWSFSFSISPPNEYLGLISLGMDWFDLLAVQGTLKSLLQQHSSKTSILRCSVFFIVQLSHPYMTTGETTALTRRTFVGKVVSLLFNMLSRFVIAFLPRSKCLNFMAAVTIWRGNT